MKKTIIAIIAMSIGSPSAAATYKATWSGHAARGFVKFDENNNILEYRFEAWIVSSSPSIYDTGYTGPFTPTRPETSVQIDNFELFTPTMSGVDVTAIVAQYDCLPSPPFTCTFNYTSSSIDYVALGDAEGLEINWTVSKVPLPAPALLLPAALALLPRRKKKE
ncbi:hypothetical protein [Pseudooceanicola nitratireducens]|uniref:hypothetical protein n=1 Tax=Pseudooceanicola nitratireducens TaxID=517719 RepID=UPI001C975DCD|nr:hypothetical protein [Pseudooceanicola nitratireducens]MBY6158419.1 hypothetical protein [Pseudooceanicola nitratireducens]